MPLKVRKSVPKKKAAPPVSAEVSRRIAKVRSRIPAERQAEDRAAAFKRIVQDEVRLEQARRAATSVLDSSLNEPVDVREAPAARSDRLRGPVRSTSNHEQVLAAIARAAHAPVEQIRKGKSAGTQTANPGSSSSGTQTARPGSSSSGTQTQARQMSSSGVQTDLIPERREDPTAAATLGYITGFAHRHALDRGRPRQRELAIVPFTPPAPPGPGVGQRLMDAAVAAEPYVRAAARGVASLGPPAARALENGVVYAAHAAAPGVAAAAQGTAAVITGAATAAQSLLPAVAHGSMEVGRAVLPVLAEGIAQGAAAIQGASASAARAAGRRAAALVQNIRDRSRSRPRLPDSEHDEPAPVPAPAPVSSVAARYNYPPVTPTEPPSERTEWEARGRAAGVQRVTRLSDRNLQLRTLEAEAMRSEIAATPGRTTRSSGPAPNIQGQFGTRGFGRRRGRK